jgi:hypothetical protein
MKPSQEVVNAAIAEVLAGFDKGERWELISDMKHEIQKKLVGIGVHPKTPVDVFLDDEGNATVRVGTFSEWN